MSVNVPNIDSKFSAYSRTPLSCRLRGPYTESACPGKLSPEAVNRLDSHSARCNASRAGDVTAMSR